MTILKNILIIEDDVIMQNSLKRAIRTITNGKINVIQAYDIEQAINSFEENKDSLDLIAFDGYLESKGKIENTILLIEKIKESYSGIMIAMSSSQSMQQNQINKGCTYSINCKSELPNLVNSLI